MAEQTPEVRIELLNVTVEKRGMNDQMIFITANVQKPGSDQKHRTLIDVTNTTGWLRGITWLTPKMREDIFRSAGPKLRPELKAALLKECSGMFQVEQATEGIRQGMRTAGKSLLRKMRTVGKNLLRGMSVPHA